MSDFGLWCFGVALMVDELAGLSPRGVGRPAFSHANAARVRVARTALSVGPASGKRCAYASDNTLEFIGLDAGKSKRLRGGVLARLISPAQIYSHRWMPG
ncbi:hypothetical protein ACFXPZ_10805 [Streptomyces sp. NPDC059101]|uniref:hypothetical protein n=1 Tax=Streptomyces sp. NPDC059101 TaxID=3346728 RepID=UPI0036CA9D6F